MLLLDEPTAALSPALAAQVFEQIARLPQLGVAALVIEQRARQSLEISDRGYILDAGQTVMSGPAVALLTDPRMTELYLGRH
jgi:branched-chain amino acid transport system ATP-binding protein